MINVLDVVMTFKTVKIRMRISLENQYQSSLLVYGRKGERRKFMLVKFDIL